MTTGEIYEINGPVVKARDVKGFSMMETVKVGNAGLIGEVIGINGRDTVIQVYEPTSGIKPGEPVIGEGTPLSVLLGPGIIGNIFDGIERPLTSIEDECGPFIRRGVQIPLLDNKKKWNVKVTATEGDFASGGYVIAETEETHAIKHYSMIPPDLCGHIVEVRESGEYTVDDWLVKVKTSDGLIHEVGLMQKWPIRQPRPFEDKKTTHTPLVTGQRVIDTLFPIAKGGTAAIPGGFGTGKTMTQHQLAKWADADIIIYIGCGERGNEMTQVLEEFSELTDPKTERPLLDRTVLIANTSNMPVAAREASIYTGITLAEYYRDMGYHVAIMADSTSRWAEALREISGRLEEMPAEEGFPAYLPSRLAGFYERAGFVTTLGGKDGSVTIIGAVSPQGGDFSEPVTQNTKRFIRCFWALDRELAYARHYPAINWINSYSEYKDELDSWFADNVSRDFAKNRARIVRILQEESNLMEIVKLIGSDVLPDSQRLELETARVIRVGYLQQNAFHADDTYVPPIKQAKMMELILHLYDMSKRLVDKAIPLSVIKNTGVFDKVAAVKYDIPNDKPEMFDEYIKLIDEAEESVSEEYNN